MKNFRIIMTLIAVIFSSIIFASDRSILFLQQEHRGHIIFLSLNEKGNQAIVNVVEMGASTVSEQGKIPIKEFEKIWGIANSKPIMEFTQTITRSTLGAAVSRKSMFKFLCQKNKG